MLARPTHDDPSGNTEDMKPAKALAPVLECKAGRILANGFRNAAIVGANVAGKRADGTATF